MVRGSLQLRHRKRCGATGKDSRRCVCGPTVYALFGRDWTKIGYLPEGWRKPDLAEFEEQLVEMRRKLQAGESYKPAKPRLLREWAADWFAELYDVAAAGDVAKSTYNTYEGQWRLHLEPEFGDTPLAAITPEMVRKFIRAKIAGEVDEEGNVIAAPLSPRTANALVTPLSAMLTDAVDEGLIGRNPCHQPRRARHGASRRRALLAEVKTERPKHLEPQEARALLTATPEPYWDMVLAALSTGFRRGELLGLQWPDVRWADGRIDLRRQLQRGEPVKPKYSSYREVPLYSGLRIALAKRRCAEGYVFADASGEPWGDTGPDREFLSAAYEVAGLRRPGVLWHSLRHTYASILAAGGIREDVVAQLMGHKRRGTTALYSHLFADAFEGIEEALDAVLGDALRVSTVSVNGSVSEGHSGEPANTRSGQTRPAAAVLPA